MESTYATVVIGVKDQQSAQDDLSDQGIFVIQLSADGNEPATHVGASGWFYNDQLDYLVNDAAYPLNVKFGTDLAAHLEQLGLVQIVATQIE
jgi:hypothetical protein